MFSGKLNVLGKNKGCVYFVDSATLHSCRATEETHEIEAQTPCPSKIFLILYKVG